MPGLNPIQPILPVNLYDQLADETKQLEELPVATGATFPPATLVSVNGAGQVQDYDATIHNMALSQEGVKDIVNVEAGPQLFVVSKSSAYVVLIQGKRLVMTASWTGGTPVILDPTHIGQQFEAAIDPTSGYTFIDLTTAGSGPFTILAVYEAPGLPEPFNTGLPASKRYNARVIVEVDPATVYVP